jgi:hypothetical protein
MAISSVNFQGSGVAWIPAVPPTIDMIKFLLVSSMALFPLFMADKAGVVFFVTHFRVTIGTVIHLHSVPGLKLIAGDIASPDTSAVAGQSVFLIGGQDIGLVVIPVAGPALDLTHVDMGDMGEIDTIGLSGVNEPGDLFFFRHILCQKLYLLRILAHGTFRVIMAFRAFLETRDAHKGPVLTKPVTVETCLELRVLLNTDIGIEMNHMAEVQWLGLLGVEGKREDNPAQNERRHKRSHKEDPPVQFEGWKKGLFTLLANELKGGIDEPLN